MDDYITNKRKKFMDVRNYCVECDKPKPCLCDLATHEFDTSTYKVIPDNASFYDVIAILSDDNNKPCDTE